MNCLYDILVELGAPNPFLEEIEVDKDGYKNPFTESGSEAYEKLIKILYCIGNMCEVDMEDIVETLDDIAQENY